MTKYYPYFNFIGFGEEKGASTSNNPHNGKRYYVLPFTLPRKVKIRCSSCNICDRHWRKGLSSMYLMDISCLNLNVAF